MANTPQAQLPDVQVDPAAQYLGEALRTSFAIFKGIMLIVLVLFLCSGIFVVEQPEAGLVLRFGKFAGTKLDRVKKPGFHWAWPYPIDEVVKVPVGPVRVVTDFSFWPETGREARLEGEEPTVKVGLLVPGKDGYNLTGDKNLVHTVWSVQYKIEDPVEYVRKLADPARRKDGANDATAEQVISAWLQNTAVKVLGRFEVGHVLAEKKDDLTSEVKARLTDAVRDLGMGLRIENVLLHQLDPPGNVIKAFNAVLKVEQIKDKLFQDAEGYRKSLREKAESDAGAVRADAEQYKTLISEKAESDADYMRELLKKCEGDKEKLDLFLRCQQILVVADFLSSAEEKFVLRPYSKDAARELRLLIGRDPIAAKQWREQKSGAKSPQEPEPEPPPGHEPVPHQ